MLSNHLPNKVGIIMLRQGRWNQMIYKLGTVPTRIYGPDFSCQQFFPSEGQHGYIHLFLHTFLMLPNQQTGMETLRER